ncbi:type IV pilin-like G/H family protein [Microcoleus sp. Pol17_C1]|uniref:type IV pilin-like G/H family protein n=1 Tax=unclassified Microcoleus TaxID=2642155 RepID=UPI002FD153AB
MQKTYLNISRLLIAGCCLFSMSRFAISAIAQPLTPRAPVPAQTTPTAKTVTEQLVGHWHLQYVFQSPVTLIFTQEGKLFLLPLSVPFVSLTEPITVYEFTYKINQTSQPMEMDITDSEGQTLQTIFEFTPNGQMRVESRGIESGEARPTTFTKSEFLLEKVSTATTLPQNTRIETLETFNPFEPDTPPQVQVYESGQYIRQANKAQQAFYAEYNKFSSTFEELGIGMKLDEENYRYQFVSQSNFTADVIMTLQAKKPELKSYTSAVFLVNYKDYDIQATVAISCATNEPSTVPPIPILPKNKAPDNFECPTGSYLITR